MDVTAESLDLDTDTAPVYPDAMDISVTEEPSIVTVPPEIVSAVTVILWVDELLSFWGDV